MAHSPSGLGANTVSAPASSYCERVDWRWRVFSLPRTWPATSVSRETALEGTVGLAWPAILA